jgi:tetratricopeptide (TPR) repeat protein
MRQTARLAAMLPVLLTCFLALVPAVPLAAQGQADHSRMGADGALLDPEAEARRFEAVLAHDSMDYDANWRGALSLIDLGTRFPDSGRNRQRDSLYAVAERYARRAVAIRPADANGHFALANAIGRTSLTRSNKERLKLAVNIRDEALKAIALDSMHDGAYHVLGRWNAEMMRVSGVSRFFAKQFLGAKIFDSASWENAITLMQRAVALAPQRVYHRLDLAEIYIDRRRYADARAQLDTLATLPARQPMDDEYKREGAALLKQIAAKKDGPEVVRNPMGGG